LPPAAIATPASFHSAHLTLLCQTTRFEIYLTVNELLD
jgi:hypothetical protein